MNWNDLKLFLAIHRAGSVRGAARALKLDHTTISRRLAGLEADCGGALFERGARGYELNELGIAILDHAEAVETSSLAIERAVAGVEKETVSGTVRITMPYPVLVYLLRGHLDAIVKGTEGLSIEINPTDNYERLDRRDADIAIRAAGNVEPDYLVGRQVAQIHRASYIRRGENGDLPWIGLLSDPEAPDWLAKSEFPGRPIRHRSGSTLSDVAMVSEGLGIGHFPCFVGDQSAGIERVGSHPPQPGYGLWVLVHPDMRRVPRIRLVAQRLYEILAGQRELIEGRRPAVASS